VEEGGTRHVRLEPERRAARREVGRAHRPGPARSVVSIINIANRHRGVLVRSRRQIVGRVGRLSVCDRAAEMQTAHETADRDGGSRRRGSLSYNDAESRTSAPSRGAIVSLMDEGQSTQSNETVATGLPSVSTRRIPHPRIHTGCSLITVHLVLRYFVCRPVVHFSQRL